MNMIDRIHERTRAAVAQKRHYVDYIKVTDLSVMLLEIALLERRVRTLERQLRGRP